MGASMIRDLTAAIIRDGKVSSDWEQSFIVCLYKGKGDALERGNYCGLKLTELVMKVLERIVDGLIRQLVSINDSQFGFVPGRGTTDTIFVVRQLQEKYLAANKRLYMAFVALEKAFDRVPRKIIWWALRKLGVEECFCVEVLRPSQLNGVMSSVVSLPYRMFTRQVLSSKRLTSIVQISFSRN